MASILSQFLDSKASHKEHNLGNYFIDFALLAHFSSFLFSCHHYCCVLHLHVGENKNFIFISVLISTCEIKIGLKNVEEKKETATEEIQKIYV